MILEIIKTDSYLLGLDKEVKNTTIDLLTNGVEIRLANNQKELDTWFKIIAHLPLNGNEPLEGVWLLPDEEDSDKRIANWALNLIQKEREYDTKMVGEGKGTHTRKDRVVTYLHGLVKGYKAAGGFTEGQVRLAVHLAMNPDKTRTIRSIDEWVLSKLKPIPIGFEVEMEEATEYDRVYNHQNKFPRPKIINKNIQGKYIWK